MLLALGFAGLLTVAGCTSNVELDPKGATVIDVRTPAEYAEGHLEGAINISVAADDYEAQLGALPHEGRYIVYCRSGNRSAVATGDMQAKGFTNVTNAGGISAASHTCLPHS